jgi:hypothetical protein
MNGFLKPGEFMNPYQDDYPDSPALGLKSLAGTAPRNTALQPNTFKSPASTTPSLKSLAGPLGPQYSSSSSLSPLSPQTSLKDKTPTPLGATYPQKALGPRTFSELTQPPKAGTASRAVYDYAESYRGMPALPAIGKAMSDYGSALKQGAKEFFTPNATYKNFLYGEGNPTAFQQAANSLAPPVALKPNTPSSSPVHQQKANPLGLKGYITTNGVTQPYYGGDTEQNANIPLGGLRLAASQQHEAEQPQGAMVLPWNSHTFYNPSQTSLSQQDINDFYTRTDLEQYRARELAKAQRDNAILSESGRTQYDPRTGRVTESAYETGGFAPSLATSETLGMRGLSPDKAAELAQRNREFESEQTRFNKPRYSLVDGVIYQQEGEGAQAFNANINPNRNKVDPRAAKALNILDSGDEEQSRQARDYLAQYFPDLFARYVIGLK